MHKNRVKDRFYAVPNCYIQHSKNCATFTFTLLKNGVSFQQVLFNLCKSFHKSSTLQLIEQQPSGSPLQHTAKMFHLLITQPPLPTSAWSWRLKQTVFTAFKIDYRSQHKNVDGGRLSTRAKVEWVDAVTRFKGGLSQKKLWILFYTVDLQEDGVSIQRGYSQQQSCSTLSGNEMVKIEHSYLNKFMVRQVWAIIQPFWQSAIKTCIEWGSN